MFTTNHTRWMHQLIRLAKQYEGQTKPNPMVAAAVINQQQLIATGVHKQAGGPHAEIEALQKAGKAAKGGTLLVTLEPCSHFGQTPPCTTAIIEAGIQHVIYATHDPNPVSSRKAASILETAGITVEWGLCESKARELNEVFEVVKTKNRPFVQLKAAVSMDGRIALNNGESRYLSNPLSLKTVHRHRRIADAILVGIGTVLADDPQLNVRYKLLKPGFQAPKKIILDPQARIPKSAKLWQSGHVIVVVAPNAQLPDWLAHKAHILQIPLTSEGSFDWIQLLEALFAHNLHHIYIEGGTKVYSSALQANIVDRLDLFYTPYLMGAFAKPLYTGLAWNQLTQLPQLHIRKVHQLKNNVHVIALPRSNQV